MTHRSTNLAYFSHKKARVCCLHTWHADEAKVTVHLQRLPHTGIHHLVPIHARRNANLQGKILVVIRGNRAGDRRGKSLVNSFNHQRHCLCQPFVLGTHATHTWSSWVRWAIAAESGRLNRAVSL